MTDSPVVFLIILWIVRDRTPNPKWPKENHNDNKQTNKEDFFPCHLTLQEYILLQVQLDPSRSTDFHTFILRYILG